MAPVRKAVANAATAVALMAAVASCRSGPGGSPGGGYHPPTPAPSMSASASTAPTPGTPGPTTPAAPTTAPATTTPAGPTTAPATTAPAGPTTAPPTIPPAPTTPPGNPPTQNPPPPPPATTPPATTPPANPPGTGTPQDEILRLTNVERQKAGCGPLLFDASLTAAAQAHSADMATNNYFSHTGLNGSTHISRARAAGWPNSSVSENIAAGSTTPAATIQMWMNSSGHRANILDCGSTHLGVGYAQGGGTYRYYWTQAFGRR